MTFEQIWESSRHNDYSWMLPSVLCVGTLVLILLNWIRKPAARRVLKVLLAITFTYLAVQASSAAIFEKWRIRYEWGKQNRSSVTEQEDTALCADGANLLMGPFIYGGGYSFWCFGATLVGSSIIRRAISKKSQQVSAGDTPKGAPEK